MTRPTGSVPGAHWGRNTQGGRPTNVRSKCTITPLDTSRARQDQYGNVPGAHWLGAQRAAQGGRQAPVRSGCDGTPSAGPPRACKEPTGCCVPGAHWVSVAPPRWTPQGRPRNPLAACQARTGVGGRSAQGDGDVNQVRARRPHWQRASRAFVGWEATRKGRVTTSNSQVRVWRHPFSWTPQVRARSPLAGCVPGAYWQRTQRARETANSQARVWRHPAGHLRGEPGTNQLAAYQARTGWGGGAAERKSDSQQQSNPSVAYSRWTTQGCVRMQLIG